MVRHGEILGHFVDFAVPHGARAGTLSINGAALHSHIDFCRTHGHGRCAEGLDGFRRNFAVTTDLQALKILRLLDRLLVIGKLDETVVRPIDDLDMLFRQFISKGPAHASIDGLIDFS